MLFAAVLLLPQFALLVWQISSFERGLITGVVFQSIGVLFILSYYWPDRSYLLRALMWCCEHTSHPARGRWTAVLWGSLAIVIGSLAWVQVLLTGSL